MPAEEETPTGRQGAETKIVWFSRDAGTSDAEAEITEALENKFEVVASGGSGDSGFVILYKKRPTPTTSARA